MAKNQEQIQYLREDQQPNPAYALKSDDGEKPEQIQYLREDQKTKSCLCLLPGDDGEKPNNWNPRSKLFFTIMVTQRNKKHSWNPPTWMETEKDFHSI